ncbi:MULTISPECIES: hypothetical protein [unclassified Streptomyces]|nr:MULTISPECIES: hypothetical protein [unclassified Streptomyces]WSP59614.1 hypothetical protein OG306_38700 [Streptomyces sp. NBC_01241]WSU19866.1 hypothetical protein OG508_01660 [Streptomyces sp. NBC_01108]MCX4791387.1 hypothetical protein [Streptomyces sp. NBC_01221]MCX4792875.1 hypothetical protein [Streptomyces sp. NBC_01242]WSP60789.1 hypothetical protein OG466_01735 [Streptomyces sp. NBC_01240]
MTDEEKAQQAARTRGVHQIHVRPHPGDRHIFAGVSGGLNRSH